MPQKESIKIKKNKSNVKPIENVAKDEKITVKSVPGVMKEEIFSLYVRGAAWLKDRDNAENRLKEICPAIQKVRHPRQKSADFCFIDFENGAERDKYYEELKANSEVTVKPVTKDVNKLLEKRIKKINEKREAKKETRRLLAQIKKKEKLNVHLKEKTNQIIVANLPAQATTAELKQQFPKSLKIDLKLKNKTKKLNSAIITFPNPGNAFSASQESIVLHGQKLNIFLNTNAVYKAQFKAKRSKPTNEAGEADEVKKEEPKKKVSKVKITNEQDEQDEPVQKKANKVKNAN